MKPVVQISEEVNGQIFDIDEDSDLKLAIQNRVQKKSNMKMTFIVSFGDDADKEWGSSLAKRCIDPWIVIKVAFWYYFVQLMLKIPLNMLIEITATK